MWKDIAMGVVVIATTPIWFGALAVWALSRLGIAALAQVGNWGRRFFGAAEKRYFGIDWY